MFSKHIYHIPRRNVNICHAGYTKISLEIFFRMRYD